MIIQEAQGADDVDVAIDISKTARHEMTYQQRSCCRIGGNLTEPARWRMQLAVAAIDMTFVLPKASKCQGQRKNQPWAKRSLAK